MSSQCWASTGSVLLGRSDGESAPSRCSRFHDRAKLFAETEKWGQGGHMSDDVEAVLAAVGPRLRELRRRRGVTLTTLSQTTGIPISILSRLESGQRKPGLGLLLPLARAYRLPVEELIGAPTELDPRVYPQPTTRNSSEE